MVVSMPFCRNEGDQVDQPNNDIEFFREKLLQLKKELLHVEPAGNEAAQTVELDQTSVGRLSRMDAMQAQAMSIETKRRRSIMLQRIESALKRMDQGEFGLCLRCEEEINPKRLEFDPTTLMCIECANMAEK
jgi:DnaK suppressor protein